MFQEVAEISRAIPFTKWGLIFLIVTNVTLVIREWIKSRTFKKNNGTLDKIGTDVEVIKTKVENQENICGDTRKRFEKAITTNQNLLVKHLEK
jgi:hypothetical protein